MPNLNFETLASVDFFVATYYLTSTLASKPMKALPSFHERLCTYLFSALVRSLKVWVQKLHANKIS